MTKHSQITQSNRFAISFTISQKEVMDFIFLQEENKKMLTNYFIFGEKEIVFKRSLVINSFRADTTSLGRMGV